MTIKVYELANEHGISAVEVVGKLRDAGVNVRNHMVALSNDELEIAKRIVTPEVAVDKKATKKKVAKKKAVKKVAKKAVNADTAISEEEVQADSVKKKTVVRKKVNAREKLK